MENPSLPKKTPRRKAQDERKGTSTGPGTPGKHRSAPLHPAEQYILDVIDNKIVVGRLVRLAVERHIRDRQDGPARGLEFRPEKAERVFRFFKLLHHSKGEWAGRVFDLSLWQQFLIWELFGWERADGTRRYRIAFISTGRKSGKSTTAAAIGNYLFLADNEPGAEIVTASTKRDQSRIVHSEAIRMIKSSPDLKPLVAILKDNLSVPSRNSKYEPLGADADTLDGLNLSGIIADEVHAWKGRSLWDVLETATAARRQALMFAITTAGTGRESLAYQLTDYSIKVLEQTIIDDSFFPLIYSLDEGDSWDDPTAWPKANPNLNISVKISTLMEECERAKQMPSAQNAFRRLRMNQWTETHSQWIDLALWDEGATAVDPEALEGRECIAGLDLASTQDITALVLLFPADDGSFDILPFFWVPEESIKTRSKRDRVLYDTWQQQGYILSTEGNVTDYDVIREFIRDLADRYQIKEIAFDRWNASQLVTQLQADGALMVPVGLGFASMQAPCREFEKLVLARKLRHGGNPVLRWMLSNISIKVDPAGNMKPDKAKSTEKIDGIVAALLALARCIVQPEQSGSIYDDPNIESPWL
jgi:phage terminase large subunit-like protein